MPTTYNTPGVYVEEVSLFPPSVAQVSTAIPAFIGYTDNTTATTLIKVPTRISSMVQYTSLFGGAPKQTGIQITADGDDEFGTPIKAELTGGQSSFRMYHALQLYFANGGGPCYIISAGKYSDGLDDADFTDCLTALSKEDEPTLIVMPDAVSLSSQDECYALYASALAQCEQLKDRFVIIDVKETSDALPNTSNPHKDFRDKIGNQNLKYGAAYYPWLQSILNFDYNDSDVVIEQPGGTLDGLFLNNVLVTNVFLNQAKTLISGLTVKMPPGSAIAGVYAMVDRTRGVWKAPANVSLNAVIKPDKKITNDIQDDMNVHASGKSINAIRAFTGQGVLVWGARTLAGNDGEWKYVPVRRLFNTVEESIKKASEFVVFEPNNAGTWSRVKGTIQNYLNLLWRQGALAGAKPEDAFFVKVGLGDTMTSQDILEGRMIIEIGIAAVRPAEFIILRFSHKLQES